MFTLHWKAFAEWLIQEEKDMDYISVLASNLQLLLEALHKTDAAGASYLCDDAAMADEGSMDTVMILKRFIHSERAGLWEKHLAEVENVTTGPT